MNEGSEKPPSEDSQCGVTQSEKEPFLETILIAAQKHENGRRFDLAIVEYQRYIQHKPEEIRVLLKLGDLQAKTGQYEAAIANYEVVGRIYTFQGFPVKAIAVYKQLCALVPAHAHLEGQYRHATGQLAALYQALGLTADALAAYDEHVNQLQQAGLLRESLVVLGKMVELSGNNPLTRLRLAEALLQEDNKEGSRIQMLKASEILMSMGRREEALKVTERIQSLFPQH